METLRLGNPPLNSLCFSHTDYQRQHCRKLLSSTHCLNFSEPSSLKFRPFYGTRSKCLSSVRMQAVEEDYELKQMKDMAAARKRWEALVREEKVKVLTPREAGYAMQLSHKTVLDVRPSTEHEKAWVKGSTWIPIFEVDNKIDAGTLSRKVTNFMMGITQKLLSCLSITDIKIYTICTLGRHFSNLWVVQYFK
ncbi:hypothetical protein CsSME_00007021 [Camellia sinensis var. sinensis]